MLITLEAWMIWRHRNKCVFNGAAPNVQVVLRRIFEGPSGVCLVQKAWRGFWLLLLKVVLVVLVECVFELQVRVGSLSKGVV